MSGKGNISASLSTAPIPYTLRNYKIIAIIICCAHGAGIHHTIITSHIQCYFILAACDHVGLCTVVSSQPTMVDATPPTPGQVSVNFYNIQTRQEQEDIVVHWSGFDDKESGILRYALAVGTQTSTQDVMPFSPVSGLVTFVDGKGKLEDGKYYYFQLKVILNLMVLHVFRMLNKNVPNQM